MDNTYEIVKTRLAEKKAILTRVETEILGNPELLNAPSGHPMKIQRANLRDQVQLLRSILADSDHS